VSCFFHASAGRDRTPEEVIVEPKVINGPPTHQHTPTKSPTKHTHHPAYQHTPATESPTKHTHHPAYTVPTHQHTPTKKPTKKPTPVPTDNPTSCTNNNFVATFSSPTQNKSNPDSRRVTGELTTFYKNKNKAEIELKIKFGTWQPNDANLKKGDTLDWSINNKWLDNLGISGWNNKCREARTGLHIDTTVACSPLSEKIVTPATSERRRLKINVPYCIKSNGRTIKAKDYNCSPQNVQDTCERGDMSGKLGQLKVKKNSNGKLLVKYKGTDKFFPRKNNAVKPDTNWSVVISKNGKRILCAEMVLKCN